MPRMTALEVRLGAVQALQARGLSDADAADAATVMVEASLMGVDTHGINQLPTYLKELDGGRAVARPQIRRTSTRPGICLLDAGDALGPVAASHATREVVALAKACGCATVAVSSSNHLGASGVHARAIAAQNQIGIVLTNSDALVIPEGGCEALCGTNPIACAAPALDGDGFFLDMATSVTAFTRVFNAARAGQPISPGWAVDANGIDASLGGAFTALMPLGGYKGQGLGMLVQILCTLLTGMPFDADLQNMYTPPYDRPRKISHCFIAIDIEAFLPAAQFRARLSELLNRFRDSRAAEGRSVRVPGDIEAESRADRNRNGIPVSDELHALLKSGRH